MKDRQPITNSPPEPAAGGGWFMGYKLNRTKLAVLPDARPTHGPRTPHPWPTFNHTVPRQPVLATSIRFLISKPLAQSAKVASTPHTPALVFLIAVLSLRAAP